MEGDPLSSSLQGYLALQEYSALAGEQIAGPGAVVAQQQEATPSLRASQGQLEDELQHLDELPLREVLQAAQRQREEVRWVRDDLLN